jgi:hypothetical protein
MTEPLVTFFTAPKPFTNPHINIIQRNAIQSWIRLGDKVQVLLLEMMREWSSSQEFKVTHLRRCVVMKKNTADQLHACSGTGTQQQSLPVYYQYGYPGHAGYAGRS